MSTLTKETARSLAKLLSNRLSTCYSDDLVAILGTGHELDNVAAIEAWLVSRFGDVDFVQRDFIYDEISNELTYHLNDLRCDVSMGVAPDTPMTFDFLPNVALSAGELRRLGRSIYLLILSEEAHPYVDDQINFILGGEGSPIDRIASWVEGQSPSYNYFPSELTLSLAQRLMQKLKLASESH